MKYLLATTAAFAVATAAHAGPITDSFCGPASGMTCETQNDAMVFLQKATDVMSGFGNIGGPSNLLPTLDIASDGGALNVLIDLANGFATITPAHGFSTFNGVDITTPGFGFTQLIFDEQLTPTASATDLFTITGDTGAHIQVLPIGSESDAADTDKEFAISAIGGVFDEVNIRSLTGFDEIKHLEIGGLCTITASGTCTPFVFPVSEPDSVVVLLLGLAGLTLVRRRNNS